jgi:glycerophosphoryl diester phosphodiesterase
MKIPRIIAHRGASFDAPENTLASFREAWLQVSDGIEGDYCYTIDLQVVCIHDDDTQRTGGKRLVVSKSTLSELRGLEYGCWKDSKFRGEPIPTLTDVLSSLPRRKWCVIELKTGPEIVPLVKIELERSQVDPNFVLIIAFDWQTIAASKRLMPGIKAHWLTDYQQGPDGEWTPTTHEIAETIKRSGADGLGTENRPEVVTGEFLEDLRQMGIDEFHVWTVDQAAHAIYYAQLGAWGLTTNRPAFLRQQLGGVS